MFFQIEAEIERGYVQIKKNEKNSGLEISDMSELLIEPSFES